MYIREIIGNKLRQVIHPELDRDIVSLGLVGAINVKGKNLEVTLRIKSKYMSRCEWIQNKVKEILKQYENNFNIYILLDGFEHKYPNSRSNPQDTIISKYNGDPLPIESENLDNSKSNVIDNIVDETMINQILN